MAAQAESVVRGKCGCGRKLRIRNALPGAQITCPSCSRLIAITADDISRGTIATDFIYVQPEEDVQNRDALAEAIPVSNMADVRLAREGARVGLTEGITFGSEDGALRTAMAGRVGALPGASTFGLTASTGPRRLRSFGMDLLASFYFAGVWNNALNILATALVMCIAMAVSSVMLIWMVVIPVFALASAYSMHFNFLVFDTTVSGEDEVPWFETNWDFWEDVVGPIYRLGAVSLICSLPAIILAYYGRPTTPQELAGVAVVLAGGWLFWPIGVMTITLGNSILCFRPDVLLRSMIAIGPRYFLAYGLCIVVMFGWISVPLWLPKTGIAALDVIITITWAFIRPAINLYFGYVLFRTLGLLYRHFHHRLPWRA